MNERRKEMLIELALEHAREMEDLLGTGPMAARQAFKELYNWIPEHLSKKVMKSYEENGAEKGEVPPFFSEVCLYELLGKDQARTLLALIHNLGESVGFTREELWRLNKDEVAKDTPLSSEDFDALEMAVREHAEFMFDGKNRPVRFHRVLRAIRSTREAELDKKAAP